MCKGIIRFALPLLVILSTTFCSRSPQQEPTPKAQEQSKPQEQLTASLAGDLFVVIQFRGVEQVERGAGVPVVLIEWSPQLEGEWSKLVKECRGEWAAAFTAYQKANAENEKASKIYLESSLARDARLDRYTKAYERLDTVSEKLPRGPWSFFRASPRGQPRQTYPATT